MNNKQSLKEVRMGRAVGGVSEENGDKYQNICLHV